jgi:hypothetical protein
MTPNVSYVGNGEFFMFPVGKGMRFDGMKNLPPPVELVAAEYGQRFNYYKLNECPDDVQAWYKDTRALRWTPETGWKEEPVTYVHDRRIVFSFNDEYQNVPGDWGQRTWMENRIARNGSTGELYYGDYWTMYEDENGQFPAKWRTSLMASNDGGRTWERRGVITHPAESMCEPMVEMNRNGEWVCVVRGITTMFKSHSTDGGYTWTHPQPIYGYGVLPQLLQLNNGVMVLGFGRTAEPNPNETILLFSTDGGYTWGNKQVVLSEGNINPMSCSYTSLLALNENSFLFGFPGAHTRFPDRYVSPPDTRKQLLARRVIVEVIVDVEHK